MGTRARRKEGAGLLPVTNEQRGHAAQDASIATAESVNFYVELSEAIADQTFLPCLAFGPLSVMLRQVGKSFLFEVFSRRFPLDDQRVALLLDQPGGDGALGPARVWFGNERGYKLQDLTTSGTEEQRRLQAVLQRLHRLAISTLRYRALSKRAPVGREAVSERTALQRTIAREAAGDQDLAQVLLDMAERLGPHPADEPLPFRAVLDATNAQKGPAVALSPQIQSSTPPAPPISPPAPPDGSVRPQGASPRARRALH